MSGMITSRHNEIGAQQRGELGDRNQ